MKRFLPLLALLAFLVTGCSLGQPAPATSVTEDGATLNGTVSSNQSGEVLYWFEYGTDTTYGTVTPDRSLTFPEGHTASDPGVPVSEPISGLEPGTEYHYRICTSPGAQPGSRGCVDQDQTFTTLTAEQSLEDSTVANFSAGTPGADTYVSATGSGTDGEVVLQPEVGEELGGAALPAGWSSTPWEAGGSATVGGGTLTLNGARAGTVATFAAGRSLEFEGAFGSESFQHLGFGDTYVDAPWAMFSTFNGDGNSLYARTNGPSLEDTLISGVTATDPHRYRIVWTATGVEYFVDGTSVATHAIAVGGEMRPLASDFDADNPASATWHWVRMGPYTAAGTFASRVLDSGQAGSNWTALQPASATPSGTQLDIETRSGDTATPDGTWSAWQALGGLGSIASPNARYLQYRVALSSSDDTQTPVLERVAVGYRPPAGP